MKLSSNGLRLIEAFEGLRLDAYPDPASGGEPFTIGIGTTVYPDGRRVLLGDRVTVEQARAYLAHDVARFEQAVMRTVTVPITQSQFDALVSLAYNVGEGALERSTLIRLLNAGDHAKAAAEFDKWTQAAGREMPGLVRRRRAERSLFELGAPAAPIEARTQPTIPQPAPESRTMPAPIAPVLAALLPSIVSLIPELGRLFGSGSEVSNRNIAAAQKVAEVVVQATGAPNLQGAIETMEREPAARQAAANAVQSIWYELQPADGGGIAGARAAALSMTEGRDWRAIGYGVTLGVLALVIVAGGGALIWVLLTDPNTNAEQRGMLIGAVVALMGSVVAFFFGSSVSSRAKDNVLVSELGKR